MLKLLTDEELSIDKDTRYKLDNHFNISGQLPLLGGLYFPTDYNGKPYFAYQSMGYGIMDTERVKGAEF